MVIRILNLVFSMCFLVGLTAQSTSDWNLKMGTNFAQGFITENTQSMQLNANIGFEREKFEMRLDAFYFIGQQGDRERFSVNHQILVGGFYYFSADKIRPYIGGQVGLAYAQSTEFGVLNEQDNLSFESAFNPVISFAAGLDYRLGNRFDLNIECRQIFGKHVANSYPTYLDEFRVSIGVGFYLINKTTK